MSKMSRTLCNRGLTPAGPLMAFRKFNVKVFGLSILAMVLFICAGAAKAQNATGEFNGHILDSTSAVVRGANVTLTDTTSGLVRTATTNETGYYQFPLLPPSVYRLTVAQPGFKTAASADLKLDVNQNSSQDFTLSIGSAAETVTVLSSDNELLQASTAELGTVIEQRTVNDLPLNGRNFTALLTLAPGVNPVNYSQSNGASYGNYGGPALPTATFVSPSIQGQWNRENVYFIDGIINSSPYAGSYDIPPIIDDLQEFKVQSHNDGAEFGGVLGGVINLVTKSGTNSFHGSAWELIRNNAFDARNPFTDFKNGQRQGPGVFRQNEFGVSVGGPVWIPKVYNGHNKTFFFFAYEGWRYKQAASPLYISPNPAELNGDFRVQAGFMSPQFLYDPTTTVQVSPGVYTRQLFAATTAPDGTPCPAGLCIPKSRIDALTQAYFMNYGNKPNLTGVEAGHPNTLLNAPGTNNAGQYTGRLDQNFGQKNVLWFRYSILNGAAVQPNSAVYSSINSSNNKNLGGGITHLFSPNLILDARVGYSGRFDASSSTLPSGVTAPTGFGAQEANFGAISFTLDNSGYASIGGSGPNLSTIKELNYAINVTWIRRNHQIRLGMQQIKDEFSQGGLGNDDNFSFNPVITSNPAASTGGNALASALLGIPSGGRFQAQHNDFSYIPLDAYIQDNWKATPNLSVNLGLRWDGETSPHLVHGTAGVLDPRTGNWLVSGGKLPPPCSATQFAPCIPVSADPAVNALLAAHVVAAPNPNLGPNGVFNDFGPRVGIAYRIGQTTVVRAGYGMVFDTLEGAIQTLRDRITAWPDNGSLTPQFNTGAATTSATTTTTVESFGTALSGTHAYPPNPTPFFDSGWYYDTQMKNHYSHQWNLEVQKELNSSLVATVAYVGSVDKRLPTTGLFNNSATPGDNGVHRPFTYAGTTFMATDRGESNYNGLEAKVDKRLKSGLSFLVSYTYSKALDNGASGFYGSEQGPGGAALMQDYNNLYADYGISANNVTHILTASSLYELPFGKGKQFLNHGFASYFAGGWQANTILQAHTGNFLTVADGTFGDPAKIGNTIPWWNYARPNLVGNPKIASPNKNQAFNTAAFVSATTSPTPEYGNSGRGVVRSTPYDNVDFSLFKGLELGETGSVQFRAEAFNLFNIINYGTPGTTLGVGGFGVVNAIVGTPRQLQFSLRVKY